MIRILIDKLGDGHGDILLKIDAIPGFVKSGDLYYMADFLRLEPDKIDKVPDDLGIEYIKYFKDKFEKIDQSETFIIFDISDQYIGGLQMSKEKSGLIKTAYVVTDKIYGHEIHKDAMDVLIWERNPVFDNEGKWLLSETSIIEGLNWSIDNIKKNDS